MTSRRVARVLIDSPLPQLDRLFDYAIPEHLAEDAAAGVRVRVPLRTAFMPICSPSAREVPGFARRAVSVSTVSTAVA